MTVEAHRQTTIGAVVILILFVIPMSGAAQVPSLGQGFRYSYRILDERGIEWGVSASSQVRKEEGGYTAIEVYKVGPDYLISRSDLPDDPMAYFMDPESIFINQLEFHLKGKVQIFVLQSTRRNTVLLSESRAENIEAYIYILDQTYKNGGQLFFDFMNCGKRVHKGDPEKSVEDKEEPDLDAPKKEPEDLETEIEKLCSQRFTFIETDIPCSEIEGAVGLSCKEIEDAIFCGKSWQSFMQTYSEGKFKETFREATDNFDRCSKDIMYFKFSMGFLLVSKYGKWYSDAFEEYLDKNKIDPMNYVNPRNPMYSDICNALSAYLFLKEKAKGFAAMEKECGGGNHYQVLQLARDGVLNEVKAGDKLARMDLFRFMNAFLKGEMPGVDLLTEKCQHAHPICNLRFALSRIATGKYDPTDFREYYSYYPLFRDLVDEFSARREQAIKAREKAEKEIAAKPPAPTPVSN